MNRPERAGSTPLGAKLDLLPVIAGQWIILIGGIMLRILLYARDGLSPVVQTESVRIAMSIIDTGTFANAYGDNSGPSAHCMPLYPLLQALLIRIFGSGAEGRYAIAFFAAGACCLGFALFPALSEGAGFGSRPGVVAGLLGAFLPLNLFAQTDGGFENSYTSLAIVVLLLMLTAARQREGANCRQAIKCGIAIGLAALLSAVLIPVIALWLLRPPPWSRVTGQRKVWIRFVVLTSALALIVYSPWVIRNRLVFGRLVLTRSNGPLETYLGNGDLAHATLEVDEAVPAYVVLGPFSGKEERDRVRAMGEPAYNAEKWERTKKWIRSHPRRFAVLTLARIRYFWFPMMRTRWQTLGEALVTIVGLSGMVWGLGTSGRQLAILSLLTAAAYPAVYYVVHVSLRYSLPMQELLIFWVGILVATKLLPSDSRQRFEMQKGYS